MAQPIIQTSFNSGEWAPTLGARVDVAKYHSGAALLENFFVDYRGGTTTSPGTKYITKAYSDLPVRLIPFQASASVSYILEFGDEYVRFINNGAPVLEEADIITGITKANPATITSVGHGWEVGDWVYVTGVQGMTPINGEYYRVNNKDGNNAGLAYLDGTLVNSTGWPAYVGPGGTASKVLTITSPYTASEVGQIKFAQNVTTMVLCHPNHPPYELKMTNALSWSLTPIVFGSTAPLPAITTISSTLATGSVHYSYRVTSVDANGQESGPSAPMFITEDPGPARTDMRITGGTNTISWGSQAPKAVSYNVYKADPRYNAAVPTTAMFGFIGNVRGTVFHDSNINPDFSLGIPIVQNPFSGASVQSIKVTSRGSYLPGAIFPTVKITGGGGVGATARAKGRVTSVFLSGNSSPYMITGDVLTFDNGVVAKVTEVSPISGTRGYIRQLSITNNGEILSGHSIATSGQAIAYNTNSGMSPNAPGFSVTFSWEVDVIEIISPGAGYTGTTGMAFTPATGGAAATVTLGAAAQGNPTVPGFFQQRLVLAGPVGNPQQISMSRPGAYYNFNTTDPIAPDDAITASLVSGTLNSIQSMIPQPQGLIVLSDQSAWLINGGAAGAPVSAISLVANTQVFAGAAMPPPITAVDHILYVQAKGSIVRDLSFNYNRQVYTGADISILSSHLFYGYSMVEWAWAEEPFRIVYVVRNDGVMLCLTILKEQELTAWSHRITQGSFRSVATISEKSLIGDVNATYIVVKRTLGSATYQYIERFVEQYYPDGVTDAWQVDCGLRYNGPATLTFRGARHLAGLSVTGLATDGNGVVRVISPFIMSSDGNFTLPPPPLSAGYTRVVVGLSFVSKLKTLGIDVGNPTIQGKMKKLPEVTVRVNDALGLNIGTDFDNLVPMDDLVVGNVGKDTNELVTNLVTGDAKQALDPAWTVPGQYCIQQSLPYPATVLGLIPQIAVGDTKDGNS